jgi:hypothetical protein
MHTVYIAHPISGDVNGNLDKIKKIARKINLKEPNVVPIAPYFLDCCALQDDVPKERAKGIANNTYLFERGFIDELRLYGNRITNGMMNEIELAHTLDIPVFPMSKQTLKQYIVLTLQTP